MTCQKQILSNNGTTTPSIVAVWHGCLLPKFSNGLALCLFRSNCQYISSINKVLVKLQHIQTDVSAHTQGQMINDSKLCSACHCLCAACRVVNSALDHILGSSSRHKPTVSLKIGTQSQSTEQKEQWTEDDFKHHYLSMYLFVSGHNVSMFNVFCNKNLPAAKQGACQWTQLLVNKVADGLYLVMWCAAALKNLLSPPDKKYWLFLYTTYTILTWSTK